MEKKNNPNPEKFIVNLKHLPPIDPHAIPDSQSQKPKTRRLKKVVKPNPTEGIKQSRQCGEELSSNILETESVWKRPFQNDSTDEGAPKKGLAKSQLYEICAANNWKPPLFECCKEEGPGHAKMFNFKVIFEIKEASTTVLECFGAPRCKKKEAAEHAAEGALWYLKHLVFL